MDKDDVVLTYHGVLLILKKSERMPWQWRGWTWRVSYWVKQDRRRKSMTPAYVESKKKWHGWTYLQNRDSQTENELMFAEGEGIVRDSGKIIYKLLYLKCITNKDLLYSTWNSTQCYVPPWMGGGLGRTYTCTRMAEVLCCSPEMTTTLLMGYTPIHS